MKKFFVLVLLSFTLILGFSKTEFCGFFSEGEYRCYAVVSGNEIYSALGTSVCASEEYVSGAFSEAYIFNNEFTKQELLYKLYAFVLKKQIVEGIEIWYCFSPKFKRVVFDGAIPYNLQIIFKEDTIIVANAIFAEGF